MILYDSGDCQQIEVSITGGERHQRTLRVLQVSKEDIKSNNGQNFFQDHKMNISSSHLTTDNGRV